MEETRSNDQKHLDCRNFVPVDVAKGICRLTGERLASDGLCCENFVVFPKCKNCALFSAGSEPQMGLCLAEEDHPWTYPELVAVTCRWHQLRVD